MTEPVHELAKKYLSRVKPSGNTNIMAICPFHRKADGSFENDPSFAMNTSTGLWFCHSCKERGNLKQFLYRIGVSAFIIENQYKYLLETIAKYVPKKADPLRPHVLSNPPLEESLLGIFDKCPLPLLEEGFEEDILRHFDVGFDNAHMRITFPLRDMLGKLVGISGRAVVDGDLPRYKVYDTEYTVWGLSQRSLNKSSLIWNVHDLYPAAEFGGLEYVVLVEGFKACMWLVQAGIRNVVALLGSYLSEDQKWILEHMGVPVFLMLDNDDAGRKGRDFIGSFISKSLPVKVVEYEGDQPSDMQPDLVQQAISQAKDYYLWVIDKGI